MKLFGTSGIRGIVSIGLIQLAFRAGLAVGKDRRRVVVACDTRTSSPAMKHAFVCGLLSAGARAYDAGVIPTPTLAYAAREFDAGAMVTASHNPPEYNGIKLVNPDGSAFDGRQQARIEEVVADQSLDVASWQGFNISDFYNGAIEQHVQRIRQDFPAPVEAKVVVDCGGGAASVITPYLLKTMGCSVVELNCCPTGFFPRPVEPTESNLGQLMNLVRERGADIGIAHDGDADRVMAVDEGGDFIPGDKLLVIMARAMAAKEIVTTIDASMAIDELGLTVSRTKVGDNYVSEELKKRGSFGGEPSGSWVFPGVSLCPDGIYAVALLAAIAGSQKLSRLAEDIPAYPLVRGSISSDGIITSQLESKLTALQPLSVDTVDGIRLNFEDGWLLIRASGTEPKVRITAEAKSQPRVSQLYESAVEKIKECAS